MGWKIAAAAAVLAAAWPMAAASEPLSLDTLLGVESWGRITVDPTGRVGVVEERRAKRDLPRYDLQPDGALRYARLFRVDFEGLPTLRPLLPMETDAGYTAGPFSPDGRRLAVVRLQGLELRLGVVDLAAETVLWTNVSPLTADWGRSIEWVSNDALVVIGVADGGLPYRLAEKVTPQTRLPDLWRRASSGLDAYVSVGIDIPGPRQPPRQLLRLDARNAETTTLTEGDFLDLEASPDGRHVALLENGPLRREDAGDLGRSDRRIRSLRLVNLQTGASRAPAGAADVATSLMTWAPDSTRLLTVALGPDQPVYITVTPGGEVTRHALSGFNPIAPTDVFGLIGVTGGWIGQAPLLHATGPAGRGWHVLTAAGPRHLETIPEQARLTAHGADGALFTAGGELLALSVDLDTRRLGRAASIGRADAPLGHRSATDAMKQDSAAVFGPAGELCRVNLPASPDAPCLIASAGSAVSWSRGFSLETGSEGRERNILNLRHGSDVSVIRRLNPELDRVTVAEPRLITTGAGARGWLYLPPGQSTPPPVIVIPYPGKTHPRPPREMEPERLAFTQNGQLLVAAGYAVLYPDLPETDEPSSGLTNRVLEIVDAAGGQGLIDPDRIGLWGWSFGAWAAVTVLTETDRFDAAVAINGAYDLTTVIGGIASSDRLAGGQDFAMASGARWLETGQAAMRVPYWQDPGRYERNSPFRRADHIHTPLLLFQSDLDHNATQAEQMYGALSRLDRPVAMTLLFGEDHSIHNPGNAHIYYDQLIRWFDLHVRAGAQAAPSTGATRLRSGPD